MASLKEQVLRRKPVGVMTEETGTDAHGGEGEGELSRSIGLFHWQQYLKVSTVGTTRYFDEGNGEISRRQD